MITFHRYGPIDVNWKFLQTCDESETVFHHAVRKNWINVVRGFVKLMKLDQNLFKHLNYDKSLSVLHIAIDNNNE